MKIICVIDEQNDFVTGSLGSQEAARAVENTCKYIQDNYVDGDYILCTKDTHTNQYLETTEGKKLPIPHCIYGTKGHEFDSRLESVLKDLDPMMDVVNKCTFGWLDLVNDLRPFVTVNKATEIIIMGLCTDICVVTNSLILKTAFPDTPIKVIANCCAGTTLAAHEAALSVMESCQIEVVR